MSGPAVEILRNCPRHSREGHCEGRLMATKPKLNLVELGDDAPLPPRRLGVHGMALWANIQKDYGIIDSGGCEYLCLACQALDRAEACRAQIEVDGQTIEVNGI